MVWRQKLSARAASASTFLCCDFIEVAHPFMENNLAINIGGYLASGVTTEFLTFSWPASWLSLVSFSLVSCFSLVSQLAGRISDWTVWTYAQRPEQRIPTASNLTKLKSGSVSQKTPWRGKMFNPARDLFQSARLSGERKNILSLKIKKKKGKISIFLFVEKGFYGRIIGEIIAQS
jgi:hypothetical protein